MEGIRNEPFCVAAHRVLGRFHLLGVRLRRRVINLGPEEIIKAKGEEIVVPGYSVPSFEDWNNDKLQDLIVGEGGGAVPGKIRVYLNVGTEADPCFADYSMAIVRQGPVRHAGGCMGCFPRRYDWDEDKRKDLLVGLGDGTVKVFLNVGSDNEPAFNAGRMSRSAANNAFNLDVGSRATSTLVRLERRRVAASTLCQAPRRRDRHLLQLWLRGRGPAALLHPLPSPSARTGRQVKTYDLLVPSGRSSPAIFDADGDGKKDIITGNTDGLILFYKNIGTDSLPAFSGYTLVQIERRAHRLWRARCVRGRTSVTGPAMATSARRTAIGTCSSATATASPSLSWLPNRDFNGDGP